MTRSVMDAMFDALLLKEQDLDADDRVIFYADGTAEVEQGGRNMKFGMQEVVQEEMKALGLTSVLFKRRGRTWVALVNGKPIWNS